ncbi:MAG: hypothetical protein IT196_06520 [Acidimicrobiales bacterium]|nr:hypothetical protein [Acidimicrobiales bacterium]
MNQPGTDLDQRIDALYAGPPEQFVVERTALVKALRAEKRRDEANAVAKLPRPGAAPWAADRVARDDPAVLDELIRAGRALVDAQGAALHDGTGAALREASAQRRRAVQRLVDAALAVLRDAGRPTDSAREELWRLAEAVSLDESAAAQLRAGRLAKVPDAPAALELLAGFAVPELPAPDRSRPAPPGTAEPGSEMQTATAAREADAAREAERALADAREVAAEALRTAEGAEAAARAELAAATASFAEAAAAVTDAEAALSAARALAEHAGAALERSRAGHAAAADAGDEARRRATELGIEPPPRRPR